MSESIVAPQTSELPLEIFNFLLLAQGKSYLSTYIMLRLKYGRLSWVIIFLQLVHLKTLEKLMEILDLMLTTLLRSVLYSSQELA